MTCVRAVCALLCFAAALSDMHAANAQPLNRETSSKPTPPTPLLNPKPFVPKPKPLNT